MGNFQYQDKNTKMYETNSKYSNMVHVAINGFVD